MTDSTTRRDLPLLLMAFILIAASWPTFRIFVLATAVFGLTSAGLLLRWHRMHPSRLPDPADSRRVEINLSSIPVGGDPGGLLFAVGSVLLVILGVPEMAWYTLGALTCGALLAGVLVMLRDFRTPAVLAPPTLGLR